jgi:hypothetical protein
MKHARLVSAGAVIGACLARLAGAAVASAAGPVHAVRSKPAGYTIVSKSFAAKPAPSRAGSSRARKRTVPLGGGVFADSSPGLRVNVSASAPFGGLWGGAVKSSSAIATPRGPISGGVFSGSKSAFVNFAGSFPTGHEWDTFVNNSTEGDISSAAVVVCARR